MLRPKLRAIALCWIAFCVALSLSLGACAGTQTPPPAQLPPTRPLPAVVTDATYPDVKRGFQRLTVQDPERAGLRERLVGYLINKGSDAIAADKYDDAVLRFSQVTELYTPTEFDARAWPDGLSQLADYLVLKGSPRGDEARVLSALLVLKMINPDDQTRAERYEKLKAWGFDARSGMSGPLERFEGLVEAWEEHARLTPTSEVMATLVRLYVERRDALVKLFQSSDEQVPLSQTVFQGVQRTALNVAAVFLRHGDTATALAQVRSLGGSGGVEQRLVEVLEQTGEEGTDGSNALLDLSRAYLENGRPDVARALCLSGLRGRRDDARFPQCLARIGATENDYGSALAWYADAIALVPEERALYDEILEVLGGLIEQGQLNSDAATTRALATRATEILQERMRRWPDSAPPVAPEELYAAIGESEMNVGNTPDAEKHLLQSLKVKLTIPAFLQLGLLYQRTGHPKEAGDQYRKALESLPQDAADGARQRAELIERVGDTERESGDTQDALAQYAKALAIWDQLVPDLKSRRAGMAELRRGVVLGRLGRAAESKAAFQRAMDSAPSVRETYATILAYMVVNAPDIAFAHEVFRNAQNQVGLEPEWKVYFALWLRLIASRNGQASDSDANEVFDSFGAGSDWSAKLARFGAGKLAFDGLSNDASALGERVEAAFYEGARRLGAGDQAGARAMFTQVIESQMVNFYEFAMAQELLSQAAPAAPVVASQPTAAPKALPH